MPRQSLASPVIKFPLNYTGGKTKLLPQILPLFPAQINCFVDLFCGGANVGINVNASSHVYNDINAQLVEILQYFQKESSAKIIHDIEKIIEKYNLSNSSSNGYAAYQCNSSQGLGKYNRAGFYKLRAEYNSLPAAKRNIEQLVALMIFAFNNQLRFNNSGEFNLPVGKRDFNNHIRQNLELFADALKQQDCTITNLDFRNYPLDGLKPGDFVYCDPPYLIGRATYNERAGWTNDDEADLLNFLTRIDRAGVKFAFSNVIEHKGQKNPLLEKWSEKYIVHNLDFRYNNSNYRCKNKKYNTQEVLITNY